MILITCMPTMAISFINAGKGLSIWNRIRLYKRKILEEYTKHLRYEI
jgi:hypothetical protein